MDIKSLDLHDIYLFKHVPFWQTSWFLYTMVVLAVMCLGVVIVLVTRVYYTRSKKRLTPQEKALKELAYLREHNMVCAENSAACYHVLTTVLKNFLCDEHALPLQHKTDTEIRTYFASLKENKQFMVVDSVFCNGMNAKFAHEYVTTDVVQDDWQRVKTFIVRTSAHKDTHA